jgi:large subunit ribosomal protein L30
MARSLKITQVRSLIGTRTDHRETIRALGLRRPRASVVKPDNEAIRGMIRKVHYLVRVEEVDG